MNNGLTLQRFLPLVPSEAYPLALNFLDDIESVRFDVITRHRTLTVLPIAMLPEEKYLRNVLPPQQEFIQHVLSRPVLSTIEATSTFIQYSSLLVSFIYKNIPVFARSVAVRMNKNDSRFLIHSVVPSFFGFFSSHEHVIKATEFYKEIMRTLPPEFSSQVMQPFFTSIVTFKFIEAIMHPFIFQFASDPKISQYCQNSSPSFSSPTLFKLGSKLKSKSRSNFASDEFQKKHSINSHFSSPNLQFDDNVSIIYFYALLLCDLIKKSIPFLPQEALELMSVMHQDHWLQEDFNIFFFEHFFNYISSLYLCASPCLRMDNVFKDVLECLKSLNIITPSMFHNAYISGKTRFEIPHIYTTLDLPYLDFALTVADVGIAINAISQTYQLPPALNGVSFSQFKKDKIFKMFAVRSYVRRNEVSPTCLIMYPNASLNEQALMKYRKKKNETKPKNVLSNEDMVIFNINELDIEDNPEFEKIFLQEHYGAGNEKKSVNDITIDLIARIGPDACNLDIDILGNHPVITKTHETDCGSFDDTCSNASFNTDESIQESCSPGSVPDDHKFIPPNMDISLDNQIDPINEYTENVKDEGFTRHASLTTQELLSSVSKALDTSDFQFDSNDAPEISSFEFNSGEFSVEDIKDNEFESNLEDQTTKAINIYMAKRCANILIRQSHVFEEYLMFRLIGQQYSEYSRILTDLESVICAPLAMNIATYARELHPSISEAYKRAITYFHTSKLKRLTFFIIASRGAKKCLSTTSIMSLVQKCDSLTRDIITKLLTHFDSTYEVNKLNHSELELFHQSIQVLRSMKEGIPVAMQVEALNYALELLRNVQNSFNQRSTKLVNRSNDSNHFTSIKFESLLFQAMLMSKCEILPAREVIFDHFIFESTNEVTDLLGQQAQNNWDELKTFLEKLTTTADTAKLRKMLVNLKKKIAEIPR